MEMLILGFVFGLIAGPILRSWIVWREYRDASRQARLADEALRRMQLGEDVPGWERDEAYPDHHSPGDR
jgi:hypothetical protein